jgi:hypothetical protein
MEASWINLSLERSIQHSVDKGYCIGNLSMGKRSRTASSMLPIVRILIISRLNEPFGLLFLSLKLCSRDSNTYYCNMNAAKTNQTVRLIHNTRHTPSQEQSDLRPNLQRVRTNRPRLLLNHGIVSLVKTLHGMARRGSPNGDMAAASGELSRLNGEDRTKAYRTASG